MKRNIGAICKSKSHLPRPAHRSAGAATASARSAATRIVGVSAPADSPRRTGAAAALLVLGIAEVDL